MKYWIECCECHEEHKVDCGSGKASEKKYNYIKDAWVCPNCQAKHEAEEKAAIEAARREQRLEDDWKEITVHYSVYKNEYAGKFNVHGERVQKGEYHADTKEIDLFVPAGKLLTLTDEELGLLVNKEPGLFSGETDEEFAARKAALMAKFEEDEVVEETEEAEEVVEDKQTLKETNSSNKWHHMDINECFIGYKNKKSALINMPGRSDYDGYSFWHPLSLVKQYMDGTTTLNFPDTWEFKLTANGGAIEERLTADEFLNACSARNWARFERRSEFHEPIKLDAVENAEAMEELVDND